MREWNRLHPANVIELLHTAAPAARYEARNLAAQISRGAWRIRMGASASTKPQQRGSQREVVVSAAGREYSLRISTGNQPLLEEILAAS